MRSPITSAIVVVAALIAGFVGGRSTVASTTEAPSTSTPTPTSATGPTGSAPERAASRPAPANTPGPRAAGDDDAHRAPGSAVPPPPTTTTSPPDPAAGATAAVSCEDRLEDARAELQTHVKRREELEGKALPARTDVAPRFASAGLLGTFQRGFQQSGVKGSVESVDCSEHPCILFGRLEGDEGEVAKLEDSPVFSAYDDDIGVMLTWASGHGGHDDDAPAAKGGAGREKPEEVSLFAFAFYATDEESQSEAIDRRIRVRTAEYWNASRPRD